MVKKANLFLERANKTLDSWERDLAHIEFSSESDKERDGFEELVKRLQSVSKLAGNAFDVWKREDNLKVLSEINQVNNEAEKIKMFAEAFISNGELSTDKLVELINKASHNEVSSNDDAKDSKDEQSLADASGSEDTSEDEESSDNGFEQSAATGLRDDDNTNSYGSDTATTEDHGFNDNDSNPYGSSLSDDQSNMFGDDQSQSY